MKNKLFVVFLSVIAIFCLAFGLTACNESDIGNNSGSTVQDGKDGIDGKDGLGIKSAEINSKGELVITYTDNSSVNLGKITGVDGSDGTDSKDGLGIKNAEINTNGELVITYTDNSYVNLGKITGADGSDGTDGKPCEHQYSEWSVGLMPTCTSIGYNIRNCNLCGDKDYEFIEAAGHEWDNGRTVISATCTENGLTLYCCNKCNATKVEVIETQGHNYVDNICATCEEWTYTSDMQYTLSSDGSYYILSRRNNRVEKNIFIPPKYNGKPVKEVDEAVFNGCSYVTGLILPETIIKIGNYAFSDCGITRLNIPSKLVEIGKSSFRRCRMLTEITVDEDNPVYHSEGNCLIKTADKTLILGGNSSVIPNDGSVECIGEEAFCGCNGFTTMLIPKTVKAIASQAFNMCEGLKKITIPESVTTLGSNYVAGYYPVISPTGFSPFMGCINLEEINVETGNPRYHSAGNCIIETAKKLLIVGCKTSVIPTNDSVTEIHSLAFGNIETLNEINIPNNITKICSKAFDGCSGLKSIYIPESVIEIGDDAFTFCKSVVSIEVSADNPIFSAKGNCLIDTVNKVMIAGCKASVIPDDGSVTIIGTHALAGLDLNSVKIPSSIEILYDWSLAHNYNLEVIEFEGTVAEWNSILKGTNWDFNLGLYTGYTIHCTDGDIEK